MFTVVIPLFNKAPYLQRALDSVYAQTAPPAEILIVNDGSTDGGDLIAKRQADPRVRVIDQQNQGVSAARNTAIEAATQPFIAFLDADDRWRPEFIARMQEAIEAHPGATLYGAGFVTMADGKPLREHVIPAGPQCPEQARQVDYFAVCKGGHPLHMSTTVVPRELALAAGGFPVGVQFCEDHIFWAQLALAGPVVLTPAILAEYDVSVPGQAVQRWQTAYKERVLASHRFYAEEMRRRAADGSLSTSFAAYCRHEFQMALLQRLYWGNFPALRELWEQLRLAELDLGPVAAACGWVAEHRWVQPAVGGLMAIVRALRGFLRPG